MSITIAGLSLFALWRLSWLHSEPLGEPLIGLNFSCNQAEYLLLETDEEFVPDDRPGRAEWCAATLGDLLRRTGARHVRISVEWSQVEPSRDQYDFRLVDALLQEAEAHGARVLLTVGIKAQRHPEYYVPDWLRSTTGISAATVITSHPEVREPALAMVRAVVAHVAASPAIEAWGAENEPYVTSARGEYWANWTIGRDFVQEVVAIIRAGDPQRRPISVNHGQHWASDEAWRLALADSDAVGTSIYPFRNYTILGWDTVVDILELGPFMVNYANQARAAKAVGKELWVTELQAEPWFTSDPRLVSPVAPSPNLSPDRLRENIQAARRSGATRLYLWGSEWWLQQSRDYQDERWFEVAAAAIAQSLDGRAGR